MIYQFTTNRDGSPVFYTININQQIGYNVSLSDIENLLKSNEKFKIQILTAIEKELLNE